MHVDDYAGGCGSHARTALSELINGKREISPEMAVRLLKVLGGGTEIWRTRQAHNDLAQVQADRIKLKRLQLPKEVRPGSGRTDQERTNASVLE